MNVTVPELTHPVRALLLVAAAVLLPGRAGAATDGALFRLFLRDGSAVVSYGEFARVDDRVIVSMPMGGAPDSPRLHVLALPAALVDWPRTDRYTASVRYQHYAATRGEADFAALGNEVAGVLNQIALSTDRRRALAIAEQAKQTLDDWPRTHFGYRQRDVQEIVTLLDEAISDLRASVGLNKFDLSLQAPAPEVELEPVLGMPSPREQVDQVIRVAAILDRSTERVALMQVGLALLEEAGPVITGVDAEARRRLLQEQIRRELEIDASYAKLSNRFVEQATRAAARADTRDIERLLEKMSREDERLGGLRPDMVQALRAAVQQKLDDGRELKLLRDRYSVRRSAFRDYQRVVRSPLSDLARAQSSLQSIRALEGPKPRALRNLLEKLTGGAERLNRLPVPADLRGPHDLFVTAWRFAENAVRTRYTAVTSGSVATAWEASSAAAGAMLMFSRAQEELQRVVDPPELK